MSRRKKDQPSMFGEELLAMGAYGAPRPKPEAIAPTAYVPVVDAVVDDLKSRMETLTKAIARYEQYNDLLAASRSTLWVAVVRAIALLKEGDDDIAMNVLVEAKQRVETDNLTLGTEPPTTEEPSHADDPR